MTARDPGASPHRPRRQQRRPLALVPERSHTDDDEPYPFEHLAAAVMLYICDADEPATASIRTAVLAMVLAIETTAATDDDAHRIALALEAAGWITADAVPVIATAQGRAANLARVTE